MGIQVAIVMGSASDWDVMSHCAKTLKDFEISHESRVLSAHRTPKELEAFIIQAQQDGVQVFITGAGLSAALPGVVAAQTTIPVIGVPLIAGSLDGMDALMSIVQMPPGIPVGTVAIGKPGAINAALYAIAILALKDEFIAEQLKNYRKTQAEKVLSAKLD
jgi:5-(carboxyamino)imidazole ribonucleotide mutase